MDTRIEKLLKLQDHDALRLQNEQRLQFIPKEIEKLRAKIVDEESGLEKSKLALKNMEVRRNEMRSERRGFEAQIVKYKTQQLLVKKNEEYQALTHEIESHAEKIGQFEETELELLMEIDVVAAEVKVKESEGIKRVELLKKEIQKQEERIASLKADTEKLIKDVEESAKTVDPEYLSAYENVKRRFKKPPFVIPIIEQKVQGLRVSNDVEGAARKGEGIVIDDNTGRIVYCPNGS